MLHLVTVMYTIQEEFQQNVLCTEIRVSSGGSVVRAADVCTPLFRNIAAPQYHTSSERPVT